LPPEPLTLGFDTSSSNCCVALTKGRTTLACANEHMIRGQAERLFGLIEETLAQAGKRWQDLTAIGVGTGPGNFTGIRLAVSAARGLSLSLGIPAVGVTMFDALALDVSAPVLTSIDARQGSVYAEYRDASVRLGPIVSRIDMISSNIHAVNPVCIGHESKQIARVIGAQWQEAHHAIPVAIALIAGGQSQTASQRPAPFYVRAANAAQPRDKPPEIRP